MLSGFRKATTPNLYGFLLDSLVPFSHIKEKPAHDHSRTGLSSIQNDTLIPKS